ncbi:MAG: type II secretion system F family protein [Pseudomonadota bacterium]
MAMDFSTPAASAPKPQAKPLFAGKVNGADRRFVTEQLTLLLETGAGLHGALETLSGQADKPALAEMLQKLSDDVADGKPFSEALRGFPLVFDDSYTNLIAAAEQGGFLPDVLQELLELDERRAELQSSLAGAAAYPTFLLVFSFAVVLFILWFVFPKFGDMFGRIKDDLPNTTRVLLAMSDVLRNQWPWLLMGMVAMGLSMRLWLKSDAGRRFVDRAKLRVPGLHQVFIPVYLIRILRPMGLALNHGVSMVDALRSCKGAVSNRIVTDFLAQVEADVLEGKRFAVAFAKGTFMPSLVLDMLRTGDETGNLAKVMLRVATHYERLVEKQLQRVSKIAEPLMLLVMGGLVGVIVSALILPIFKLTRAVG